MNHEITVENLDEETCTAGTTKEKKMKTTSIPHPVTGTCEHHYGETETIAVFSGNITGLSSRACRHGDGCEHAYELTSPPPSIGEQIEIVESRENHGRTLFLVEGAVTQGRAWVTDYDLVYTRPRWVQTRVYDTRYPNGIIRQ